MGGVSVSGLLFIARRFDSDSLLLLLKIKGSSIRCGLPTGGHSGSIIGS